jgi:hypothetical protein
MKKGMWLGGLLLSLGSWASGLSAQEVIWRPTVRPAAGPPKAAGGRPGPAATLGRPVVLPGDGTDQGLQSGPQAASGLVQALYQGPAVLARVQSPELVASSMVGQPESQETGESGVDFAADRVVPADWRGDGRRSQVVQASFVGNPNPVAQPAAGMPYAVAQPSVGKPYTAQPYVANPYPVAQPYVGHPVEAPTDSAFFPGEGAVPASRFYLNAEYLLWWTKSDKTPPLATTSSDPNDFGFLGNPTTQVLFGGNLDRNPYHGARVTAGFYLDPCGQTAIEVSGFILGQETARFTANSAQFPVIARPFFNLNQNQEFSQLVAFPGVSTGNLQIRAPSRLWGAESNLRCNVCCGCDYKVDALAGFRYLDLDESITIQENIQGLAGAPPPFTNAQTTVVDRFATHNQFYGGQIGVDSEFHRGAWVLGLRGKLGLGDTHQRLTIDGSERIVAPDGTVQNFRGGLLALPSNIGQYTRDRFSVVPEVGVSLGYQLTEHLRVSVGYNFLYWTNVLRPGKQIDRVIDVTQIPNFNIAGSTPTGQNRPAVPFKESDFWAQGLTVGLEFRY